MHATGVETSLVPVGREDPVEARPRGPPTGARGGWIGTSNLPTVRDRIEECTYFTAFCLCVKHEVSKIGKIGQFNVVIGDC
jgi:hypothetical protein